MDGRIKGRTVGLKDVLKGGRHERTEGLTDGFKVGRTD